MMLSESQWAIGFFVRVSGMFNENMPVGFNIVVGTQIA
jgi:hypothetical protein